MPKPSNPGVYDDALLSMLSELESLMSECEDLENRLENANRRIGRLRRGAIAMSFVCGMPPGSLPKSKPELFPEQIDSDTGLTDAVREILTASKTAFFSPIDIRERLKSKKYDISKYKNVLASIHTILKRLKTQGEAEEGSREGRTTYRWTIKMKPGVALEDVPF